MTADTKAHEGLAHMRVEFIESRRALIAQHGAEAFDQAHALYLDEETGQNVVVTDAFAPDTTQSVDVFITSLKLGWWRQRAAFAGAESGRSLCLIGGCYAHYLPEVGFDYGLELRPAEDGSAHVESAWRMNGIGRTWPLAEPDGTGTFRDQTGTFFHLRSGWRWLVAQFREEGRTMVAEVHPGYTIGVRAGVPGDPDPAGRPDEELDALFSRAIRTRYDTLEFLGGGTAEQYPFEGERFGEWLIDDAEAVASGTLELFALAESESLSRWIEELAEGREVTVHPEGDADEGVLRLVKGPLSMTVPLGYLLLRALHTGRSFATTARTFVAPSLDALEEAHQLFTAATGALPAYHLAIEDGAVLTVTAEDDTVVARCNLLGLAGRQSSHGRARLDELLQIMGYDSEKAAFRAGPVPLNTCSVCGRPARVGKVIRPTALLAMDVRLLAGVEIGDHFVHYIVECPQHTVPIQADPDRGVPDLETAYREGLESAEIKVLGTRKLGHQSSLFVGFDIGSLVLEPDCLMSVLEAAELPSDGDRFVYAFHPDALVVAARPLDERDRASARSASAEAVTPLFPDRTWPLDVFRKVRLDGPPRGRVEIQ